MKPKLLILPTNVSALRPSALLELTELAPRLELLYIQDGRQVSAELLRHCEVIYGRPPVSWLREALLLRWLHLPDAGVEPYGDLRLYANPSILLTNASGVYGKAIAEHVLAMTLSLMRRLPHYIRAQNDAPWRRHEDMRELGAARVLILGMGDLGRSIAALFAGIGCHVWGIRRKAYECPPEVEECFSLRRLTELLPGCDVVVNALPATAETVGLFNAGVFRCMHRDAVFINVGRGNAVDHEALTRALEAGALWGAGLDVTNPEPFPPEHPLWRMENVIITPHSSGASQHTIERNTALFRDLLRRYAEGRRLVNRVDFYAGY